MIVLCVLMWLWVCIHSSGAVLRNYYWRDYSFGDVPDDAIEIHNDGKYVGHAYVNGSLLPVTIYPHYGFAIGELYGKVVVKDKIQILCTPEPSNLYWDLVNFNKPVDGQMKNAIIGGFHKNEFNYFIGKTHQDGEWRVSKVIPMENLYKGLVVWNSVRKPNIFSTFLLLKYNSASTWGDGIRKYDGTDDYPVRRWVEDAEDIGKLVKWSDLHMFTYAKRQLTGLAKLFFEGERGLNNWKDF
ncbi:hypothetical protein Trydic_g1649 [Trypoxylus dichotomus]